MVFLSICTALYDYAPQGDNELEIQEGELVYILEKSDEDDWWKAKKRAPSDEEEEPTGLIPNNYVEEVRFLSINPEEPVFSEHVGKRLEVSWAFNPFPLRYHSEADWVFFEGPTNPPCKSSV